MTGSGAKLGSLGGPDEDTKGQLWVGVVLLDQRDELVVAVGFFEEGEEVVDGGRWVWLGVGIAAPPWGFGDEVVDGAEQGLHGFIKEPSIV